MGGVGGQFPRNLSRPFPSSKKSHFQGKAKCEAIDTKMSFNFDANKTHFHNKGFALSLVLKVRCFGTRKWPIDPTSQGRKLGTCYILTITVRLTFAVAPSESMIYTFKCR